MAYNTWSKWLLLSIIFFRKFSIRLGIISEGRRKFKKKRHSSTIRMSPVLKSLNKNLLTAKSKDLRSDLFRGQTSVEYNRIGRHFVDMRWRKVSSEAQRPIFPKIELTALKYLLLLCSKEHLNVNDAVIKIPKYLILCAHGIAMPWELVILQHSKVCLGPIRTQYVLLTLIDRSNYMSSRSQLSYKHCSLDTEGEIMRMSSA